MSKNLSKRDKTVIYYKTTEAIIKIKSEHVPMVCKTVDNDLRLFDILHATAATALTTSTLTGLYSLLLLYRLLEEDRKHEISYKSATANKQLGSANSLERQRCALGYNNLKDEHNWNITVSYKISILSALITPCLFGSWYMICNKSRYNDAFKRATQLRWLNNIKSAL